MKKIINFSQFLLIVFIVSCGNNRNIESQAKQYVNYEKTSYIDSLPANDTVINNLEVLAKVWGFVKYYHPNFEDSLLNIDYELFELIPKIVNIKADERNEVLCKWVDSLGDYKIDKEGYQNILKNSVIKVYPSTEWTEDTSLLGKSLSEKLINIKYSERKEKNIYVQFTEDGNPLFKNEDPYLNISNLDCGYRLLSLFRYWNIIEYYFPTKYLTNNNWNTLLNKYIPLFITSNTKLAYEQACLKLIAEINDTHAYSDRIFSIFGYKIAPLKLAYIENKIIVIDSKSYLDKKNITGNTGFTLRPNIERDNNSEINVGDEIVMINNHPVDSLIKNLRIYTSISNESVFMKDAVNKIILTKKDNIHITYKNGNHIKDTVFICITLEKYNAKKGITTKIDQAFKLIDNSTGYINSSAYNKSMFKDLKNKLQNTKGIIIDIRSYPSRDFSQLVRDFFVPKNSVFAKVSSPDQKIPGLFTMSDGGNNNGNKFNNKYKNKIVILVNENTQSYGEFMTMALQSAPNSIVIGSATAGADGNVSQLLLPGNISTLFSALGIYYPNDQVAQRIGISINEIVKPTVEGLKKERDEVLERAIEIVTK